MKLCRPICRFLSRCHVDLYQVNRQCHVLPQSRLSGAVGLFGWGFCLLFLYLCRYNIDLWGNKSLSIRQFGCPAVCQFQEARTTNFGLELQSFGPNSFIPAIGTSNIDISCLSRSVTLAVAECYKVNYEGDNWLWLRVIRSTMRVTLAVAEGYEVNYEGDTGCG